MIHKSEQQISDYLLKIKECVKNKMYLIDIKGGDREKNENFILEFQLNPKRQEDILNNLTIFDFCECELNKNANDTKHRNEELYKFAPTLELIDVEDIRRNITMYIKTNIVITRNGCLLLAISFHEAEFSVIYPFLKDK